LPEVINKVRAASVDELEGNLLIIRMLIELRAKNIGALQSLFDKILLDPPRGYEMYQVMTARLIVAYWNNDKAEFLRLADLWLDGSRTWRGNWNLAVLEVEEFKPWFSSMDEKLVVLKPLAPREITAEDRAFIKDERGFLLAALKENLAHFRAMNLKGNASSLAKQYHISSVNRDLREITFDAEGDLPGLIVALDTDGNFAGSFIAH
jgi:hypothetical protein